MTDAVIRGPWLDISAMDEITFIEWLIEQLGEQRTRPPMVVTLSIDLVERDVDRRTRHG